MVASIINSTVTSVASATITVARPDDVQEGDLLLFMLAIGGVLAEAATLTFPDAGWRQHIAASPYTGSGASLSMRQFQAFKYATATEPALYTFGYSTPRILIGTMVVIRGVQRDWEYDSVNYPFGYFAPGNPTLGAASQVASTAITPFPMITTAVESTVGVFMTVQYDAAGGSIAFDDPVPLVEILQRVQYTAAAKTLGVIVMTGSYPDIGTVPATTVTSPVSAPWIATAVAIESFESIPESVDNYKSKVLRKTLPPPYDTRLSSNLGKLLSVIGTSDNDIGGLFGADDFLPDEEL